MGAFHDRPVTVLEIRSWAERGRLLAVIDATDTPAVPAMAQVMGGELAVSLYKGRAEETLSAIAPYLFRVDAPTLDWIAGDLWGEPWGFFALADQSLDDLRRHFRRFLTVEAPDGDSWYFRFYDPRVLVKYLPTCTVAEVTAFFGPARALAVTDPETYGVRVLALGDPPPALTPTLRHPIVIRR